MTILVRTRLRRIACSTLVFFIIFFLSRLVLLQEESNSERLISDGELMIRLVVFPAAFFIITLVSTSLLAASTVVSAQNDNEKSPTRNSVPFIVQVVGLQWLNPLQRVDYPTEWQLLWTLGLAQPNKDDEMVETKPEKYRSIRPITPIADANDGKETFAGFHEKYLEAFLVLYRDIYFSDSRYFYNAHSIKDKSTWRELAGIRVEYAFPSNKLDANEVTTRVRKNIIGFFDIGLKSFPKAWTHDTPPDVRVTTGGPNAGFSSLAAGLEYLRANPSKTAWVMNWDAPSFPLDTQMNENLVLLVLAGPDYKTGRAPLAWLSQPVASKVENFETGSNLPSRSVQAWKATLRQAALNAGKKTSDIGFVIHDANATHAESSDRLAPLAQTITEELPELDFMQRTFNTPALLGEMGAGTALTNVALGIAYANHIGKTVLIAGTTDPAQPTATVVAPPAVVRPILPGQNWFRARAANHVHLPWWGLRHDMKPMPPGYSR
ncbi:hypothetical protein [Telluria beijingensis]|uniref:hypothetical protein n=1 Tax=Telluria beijingensis TaxID=3068633 RepID=UPI0027959FA9|nr:hypothetical protein [Massilia sp. REN29]